MIKSFAFVEIVVADFEKAVHWYTKVLGLHVHGQITSNTDGLWCQFHTVEGALVPVALWQPMTADVANSVSREKPVFIPVFVVKGLDKQVSDLKAAGVKFTEGIRQRPGYRITTILDMEENRLQLVEFDK